MKTWINLFILFVFVGFISCDQAAQKASDTAEEAVEEVSDAVEENTGGGMSLTPEDIEKLQNKFTYDAATGYYKHNRWGGRSPQRRTLTADVYKNGSFTLASVYYGDAKVDHNRIIVTAGDQRMTSDRVTLSNESEHVVQKDKDKRYEINYYTNYRDKGIFEAIGKGIEGEINVRFDGPDRSSSVPLNSEDMAALKDCYMLSLLLRSGAVTPPVEE